MNMKLILLAVAAGLTLVTLPATAAPSEDKGIITTLDVQQGRISVDTRDMLIGKGTRVKTAGGRHKSLRDLALRQHVHFKVDKHNVITRIRIYPADSQQLRELGFDEEAGND